MRERLFGAFRLYVDVVGYFFESARLWVDGGFVSLKTWAAPSDIDVVVVVPRLEYENVCSSPRLSDMVPLMTLQNVNSSEINNLGRLQPMGGLVDAFIIPDTPVHVALWDATWSRVKDENGVLLDSGERKGYLEVTM
ncbi:hypothetical protein OK17_18235 [Gordonia sp. GN26]